MAERPQLLAQIARFDLSNGRVRRQVSFGPKWTNQPTRGFGRDPSLSPHTFLSETGCYFKGVRLLPVGRNCRILLVVSTLFTFVCIGTGAANASVTDPRKCATVTPGGPTKHAYWCVHNAAVTTARSVMARRQHVTRWFAPTFCDQAGTLLRWRCSTSLAGDRWLVAVTWKATSSGWHRYASVTVLT